MDLVPGIETLAHKVVAFSFRYLSKILIWVAARRTKTKACITLLF